MKINLLCIGNELLDGRVVNSHQHKIGRDLNNLGLSLNRVICINDNKDEIVENCRFLCEGDDWLIITGGLGPTHDDVTRDSVAEFSGTRLVENKDAKNKLIATLKIKNRQLSPRDLNQVLIPDNAKLIPNNNGTAAAFHLIHDTSNIICLPGVPNECYRLLDEYVYPTISEKLTISKPLVYEWCCFGCSELELFKQLQTYIKNGINFNFRLSYPYVYLMLSVVSNNQEEFEQIVQIISDRINKYVITVNDESLVENLKYKLVQNNLSISLAESCTGGKIASILSEKAGISAVFQSGIVTYSNKSKQIYLNVNEDTIAEFGAVSDEVANEMLSSLEAENNVVIVTRNCWSKWWY